MSEHITISGVSKLYGEHQVQALKDVSLQIERGKFVALMGPSGCGKSTLLNLLAGIDDPSAGTIELSGVKLSQMSDAAMTAFRRDHIGFVFQFFNLLSTLTVRENVALPLELAGQLAETAIVERTDALLDELGIKNRHSFYPSQLSGGEMQRAAIARAIIHQPELVLADEPTGNLDSDTGARVLDLLKSISTGKGITLVMATHSLEAAAYADSIVRMKDGQITAESVS